MIEIADLVKVYGERHQAFQALRGIGFHVARGEFAAIMGPSGCGKSTLLNILGLLDNPTSGSYRLDGVQAASLDDRGRTLLRRGKIGFVFQSFNLLPRMTSLENVALPMAYAGMHKAERLERGRELLGRMGLKGKESKTPLELSGGERQRVSIARSLANRPALLLADEPTGNLDSKTSAEILDVFSGLHKDGMTILLVTHDRAVADRAQRVLHVRDGMLSGEERKGT